MRVERARAIWPLLRADYYRRRRRMRGRGGERVIGLFIMIFFFYYGSLDTHHKFKSNLSDRHRSTRWTLQSLSLIPRQRNNYNEPKRELRERDLMHARSRSVSRISSSTGKRNRVRGTAPGSITRCTRTIDPIEKLFNWVTGVLLLPHRFLRYCSPRGRKRKGEEE